MTTYQLQADRSHHLDDEAYWAIEAEASTALGTLSGYDVDDRQALGWRIVETSERVTPLGGGISLAWPVEHFVAEPDANGAWDLAELCEAVDA